MTTYTPANVENLEPIPPDDKRVNLKLGDRVRVMLRDDVGRRESVCVVVRGRRGAGAYIGELIRPSVIRGLHRGDDLLFDVADILIVLR